MKPIQFSQLKTDHAWFGGVYCITNKITGKKYFGSSYSVRERLLKHRSALASHSE